MSRQYSPAWEATHQPPAHLAPPPAAHATARRLRVQQFTPLLGGLGAALVVPGTVIAVFSGALGLMYALGAATATTTGPLAYGWVAAFGLGIVAVLAAAVTLYSAALRYLGARWPWAIALLTTGWGAVLVVPLFLVGGLSDLFPGFLVIASAVSAVPVFLLLHLRAARSTNQQPDSAPSPVR